MEDLVKIPKITDPHLRSVAYCGNIKTGNKRMLSQIEQLADGRIVSRIPRTDPIQFVELFGGGGQRDHLHVNLIAPTGAWKPKGKTIPIKVLQTSLSEFVGQKVVAHVTARFVIATKRLPVDGIIRSAMGETDHEGIPVRQTAQQLSIGDGPVSRLTWSLSPDSKTVYVEVLAIVEDDIDHGYLKRSLEMVSDWFDFVIL